MEVRVRHMVTRDRQNINGIRLNVWRRRILQERFARNRSIITTWANFEATGKLFTLSWLPLRIIAELSAAMWNAAVIYSAWQRIVQSAAYKLNSVTKRKKKKKITIRCENCYFVERSAGWLIDRGMFHTRLLQSICRLERHFRRFDARSFIWLLLFFFLQYISTIGRGILFCHENWSWEVRIAWPIFPRKMEQVSQKGSLRLWSLMECEKIFSKFHKLDYFARFKVQSFGTRQK